MLGLGDDPRELDLYVPIFLIAEFLFYFGWLNVASTLYNPFGDDDDDFELIGLMNRHIKVTMQIVDEDKEEDIPEIQDDEFWQVPSGSWPTLTNKRVEVKVEENPVIKRKWSMASRSLSTVQEVPGDVNKTEERDTGLLITA